MKSLGDAIELRNQLIAQLEEADFECNLEERRPLLTVLVAGGGFAGVETVAAVNDFVGEAIRFTRTSRRRTCALHSIGLSMCCSRRTSCSSARAAR
jgi:NADH dehydrogenase FAD-containing subunit